MRKKNANRKEPNHAPDITPPEKDHRPRHARVQTRRTQERGGGKGGKVKSRRQAIAIALKEAGASKYESEDENKRNLAKSERKEARGETYQQEPEGKSRVGARGRRESSRGMGGMDATRTTAKGRKAARTRARHTGGTTKQELYRRAKARGVEGRSKMSKAQLENALR